jgi:hypothetical protein
MISKRTTSRRNHQTDAWISERLFKNLTSNMPRSTNQNQLHCEQRSRPSLRTASETGVSPWVSSMIDQPKVSRINRRPTLPAAPMMKTLLMIASPFDDGRDPIPALTQPGSVDTQPSNW